MPTRPFELLITNVFVLLPARVIENLFPPSASALVWIDQFSVKDAAVPVPKRMLLKLLVAPRMTLSEDCVVPTTFTVGAVADTSKFPCGLAVPMPTLPVALISMLLVGAPGRMRNGKREPP